MIGLIWWVLVIIGGWKMFVKAGKPGWGIIIPFYNTYLLCKVAGRPGWWLILFFIPIVNIIIWIIVAFGIAENFGHGAGYGILVWLFAADHVPGARVRRRHVQERQGLRPAPPALPATDGRAGEGAAPSPARPRSSASGRRIPAGRRIPRFPSPPPGQVLPYTRLNLSGFADARRSRSEGDTRCDSQPHPLREQRPGGPG